MAGRCTHFVRYLPYHRGGNQPLRLAARAPALLAAAEKCGEDLLPACFLAPHRYLPPLPAAERWEYANDVSIPEQGSALDLHAVDKCEVNLSRRYAKLGQQLCNCRTGGNRMRISVGGPEFAQRPE